MAASTVEFSYGKYHFIQLSLCLKYSALEIKWIGEAWEYLVIVA